MSLRAKMIGGLAAALLLVIMGFSVAMVFGLRASLTDGAFTEARARAAGLGSVVEWEGGAWVIEDKTGVAGQYGDASGLYYRIADAAGAVVLASPLASTLAVPDGEPGARRRTLSGRTFAEVTIDVAKKGDDDEPLQATTLRVTCGRDLGSVEATIASLVGVLWWVGPAVLLLALSSGWLLVGGALRPIEQIARTAAVIGERDLGQRIPVRGRDELARLAGTLNLTFDRLQAAFARQERFTADAAHELRTPLAVVAADVELALSRERPPDERRELLVEIGSAAQQMQALVTGLLQLARADRSGLTGEVVPLDDLCRNVVAEEEGAARAAGVSVRLGPLAAVAVRGDAACLAQVVRNLVQNGVRHNRSGGCVEVSLVATPDRASLRVMDDGLGIPAAALPRVGERFFRVDPSRSRATGGTGLGLSIVEAIAVAHGGSMTIDSVEGQGTTVTVDLPIPRVP